MANGLYSYYQSDIVELTNTEGNHNKFYNMKRNPGGRTFTIKYGRIGSAGVEKTYNINPFDKESILEGKQLILREAREASPNYKMFIKAAKLATQLSERTIKSLLYTTKKGK